MLRWFRGAFIAGIVIDQYVDKIAEQIPKIVAKPKNLICKKSKIYFQVLLCVHEEVNDWVEGRVSHGEPEEGQEHVLGVGLRRNVCIIVVDEVGMVGQPAHPEYYQHHYEHDADLE